MAEDVVQRALSLEERLRTDSALAQQACEKAMALRESLRQAAELRADLQRLNEGRRPVDELTGESANSQERAKRWLNDLSEENRELHALVNELHSSLDVIMQRHREQVDKLTQQSREAVETGEHFAQRERIRSHGLEEEAVRLSAKIQEMAGVMFAAAAVDVEAQAELQATLEQLEEENTTLRSNLFRDVATA